MIKINLNPKKKGAITKAGAKKRLSLGLPKFKSPVLKIKGIVYVAIPLLILGAEAFYYLKLDYSINKLKNEIYAVDNQINKYKILAKNLKALERQIEEQKKLKESIRTQIRVFQKFAVRKGQVLRMFKTVAISMPDGVWLTKMDISKTSSSADISGYSFNPKLISRFMRNLNNYYSSVNFTSTKRIQGNIVDFYEFNLHLTGWKEKEKKKVAQNINN